MTVGILITAAGKSRRFQLAGGQGNKLNSDLGGQTVFEITLQNAIKSQLPIHVITRPDNQGVITHCLQHNVPYSLINSEGLGETIAFGVKNTAHWDGWLIQLADMPYITENIFIRVANELKLHPLVRPIHDGKPGHPVGISAQYRQQLIALTGDDGAKSILQGSAIYRIEMNNSCVINDIDYPIKNESAGH
ncbi:nucleotidyltransferase family protein [Providencia sneebia]|uniref:MobA-like NTP transferase domain-containing protein n=1 Tax=Providencia sneebia DSM 19967 TaxID=1141660 RepID=K8W9W3_9GAMM|nr:nucleotidyltransferase family protein [Providencia sneebia]EKT54267.1 hypothetical protein OO7_14098 [Providencia sneebia DSM 19967]